MNELKNETSQQLWFRKTHLQIAAAGWIIQNVQTVNKDIVNAQSRGCRVVCISDVTL